MRSQMYKLGFVAVVLASSLILGGTALADLVATDSGIVYSGGDWSTEADVVAGWTSATGSAPVNAANDLLRNNLSGAPTLTGSTVYGSQMGNINDGLIVSNVYSNPGNLTYTDNLTAFAGGSSLVFNLDKAYDLGRIDSFTAWQPDRIGQKYNVYTSTDGGSSWALLTSVNYDNYGGDVNKDVRRISLTDTSGTLALGVNALKFAFSDPGSGNGTAIYGEIAAYAAVPEPATSILTLTSVLGLAAYAWRKQK
jgi:hypothetical protein